MGRHIQVLLLELLDRQTQGAPARSPRGRRLSWEPVKSKMLLDMINMRCSSGSLDPY